ncbi:hypothetical protein KY329_02220 [Candidatus Woesearchaeota archaeon]|nr:hypothetical protein [Candidatus Woesearchaeota archaeon]
MASSLETIAHKDILRFNAFSIEFCKEHGAVTQGCHFSKISGALVEQLFQANSLVDVKEAAIALHKYMEILRNYDSFRQAETSTAQGFFPDYDFNPAKYVAHSYALLTDPF